MPSILQDWVVELGLRHQGALIGAVRGCDNVTKTDPAKVLVRALRAEFLVPAVEKPTSFIQIVDLVELDRRMAAVLKSFDHYPIHFLQHLIQAAEIVGYKKPNPTWSLFYMAMCHKLHVGYETESQLDARLNADEETFQRNA